MRIILITALLLAGDLKSEFASLVDTERAFARLSVEKGMREARSPELIQGLQNMVTVFREKYIPLSESELSSVNCAGQNSNARRMVRTFTSLSPREREILALMTQGLGNRARAIVLAHDRGFRA